MLAPETNGEVAVKAWEALQKQTGREHAHLAQPKEDEKIRFRDLLAQPRKIITSPTWSGIESEKVCYTAGYTNVHELIPWLQQWHNEVDPAFDMKLGDYFSEFIESECRSLAITHDIIEMARLPL